MAKVVNVIYKVDDKALLKAKTEIQGIEKETKDSEKEMLKLDKAVQKVGNNGSQSFLNFKNILSTISVVGIVAGLTQLGKKILDLGIKQEQLNIAFTTFLGSASKAKTLLAELTKFSIVTPFSPDQVNQAAKALLAFGVKGREIIPTLKMLGDVSAGTGKDLTEMAIIFGQIRSTGRLMGQDLLQLINAGFNPLQIISEQTGKSVAKLKDEMEKGRISFEMVAGAFKTATSEGGLFFNLMDKQSVSIGGKLSTVAGNIEEVFKNIFSATSGPLADFVDKLTTISEAFLLMSRTPEQFAQELADIKLERFKERLASIETQLNSTNKKIQETGVDMQNLFAQDVVNAINEVNDELNHMHTQGEFDALNAELSGLHDIRDELLKLRPKEINSTKELTKEEKKLFEQRKKERAEALKLLMSVGRRLGKDIEEGNKEADERQHKREKENAKRSQENVDRQHNYELEKLREAEDEKNRILEEAAERRKEIQQAAQDFAIDSIQQILYATLLTHEEDFTAQREKFDREMELAGDNERAKEAIKRREEDAEKAFRQRQKEAEKQNALKRIAIDTAINVIRSISNNGGIPLGLPFGALAAAAGLVQAAVVRKLAKGEVGINGPGTKTSDSIPAMLSVGESVINADATSKSSRLLEAINDRRIDDRILGNAASGGSKATEFDYKKMGEEFRKGKVDYDTHGYTIMKGIEKGRNFKMYVRAKVQGYK
ncbi:MAG TPA: tape measure protein [Chryseolinea sp.]|nr:tape measure protein [Chryseolinea sp.]